MGPLLFSLWCSVTVQVALIKAKKYALSGFRIQNRQTYGVELGLLASLVLAGSSVPRAIKSQKPLPIGLSLVAAFGLYRFGSLWDGRVR